jgi:dipeptidyl aminopeptidase
MPLNARVISEVQWVGDDQLLIKEVDRAARNGNVIIVEDGKSEGQVVRILGKNGEEGDDGWIDHVSVSSYVLI